MSQLPNYDKYLNQVGKAIAALKEAKKHLDEVVPQEQLLSFEGREMTTQSHTQRVNYIIQLIQDHIRIHLQEVALLEAKLHLKSADNTPKLLRAIKAHERDVMKEQNQWSERIELDEPLAKRTKTILTMEEYAQRNCAGKKEECECCDQYAEYLINELHLGLSFEGTSGMPENLAKRKEIWRRLQFLVTTNNASFLTSNVGKYKCLSTCLNSFKPK
jgi:hypothetical protein